MLYTFLFIVQFSIATEQVLFTHSVDTCVPKNLVWLELENAMTDSNDSAIWPNTNSNVLGSGIFDGANIQVEYHLGLFSQKYSYVLKNVIKEEGFTYVAAPDNHPFSGGATITLISNGEITTLNWLGEYETKPNQWLQRLAFRRYVDNFFQNLDKNINDYESFIGCKL